MSDLILSPKEAHHYLNTLFLKGKCSKDNAKIVTNALLLAESDGLKGHGLSRIPTYIAQSLSGKVKGEAKPSHQELSSSLHKIDAQNGFAYPALLLAEEIALKYIQISGIVCIGIHNSHHAGACGHVVERLARKNLVAMLFANTPAAIAPWGGNRGSFGTNPIAFATPRLDGNPVVVDLALSKVARGNIVNAAQKGEAIPDDWALDVDGNRTTDAKAALKGTMLPLGDAKGTTLAFMVEVLAAGLTGANFAGNAPSFLEAKGEPPNTGQLLIAINPQLMNPHYLEHLQILLNDITSQNGARLSGEKRFQRRESHKEFVFNQQLQAEIAALPF